MATTWTVWQTVGVEAADKAFDKAVAQVRSGKLRVELLEAYETAVKAAAETT